MYYFKPRIFHYYKPIGGLEIIEENDDFTMPDREWFTKQFQVLNSKVEN